MHKPVNNKEYNTMHQHQ